MTLDLANQSSEDGHLVRGQFFVIVAIITHNPLLDILLMCLGVNFVCPLAKFLTKKLCVHLTC